jgi:hypothetical protein
LGVEQQHAFDLINDYLSLVLVLKAPKRGFRFRLYIAAEDKVVGVVLTQETKIKEHGIIYLSRRWRMQKQGTPLLRNFVYACFMCVGVLGPTAHPGLPLEVFLGVGR